MYVDIRKLFSSPEAGPSEVPSSQVMALPQVVSPLLRRETFIDYQHGHHALPRRCLSRAERAQVVALPQVVSLGGLREHLVDRLGLRCGLEFGVWGLGFKV